MPKKTRNTRPPARFPVAALIGIVAVVVVGVATALLANMLRAKEQSAPMASLASPVVAAIILPDDGAGYIEGASINFFFRASALEPLAEMELYRDGAVVDRRSVAAGKKAVLDGWDLTAADVGTHSYYIIVRDERGNLGHSNVVAIQTLGEASFQYTAKKGETFDSIGKKFGVDPASMTDENPAYDPEKPLAGGEELVIGTRPAGVGSLPLISADPGDPPAPEGAPVTAGLAASANGCAVQLAITDNSEDESGFRIYRQDDSSSQFLQIAELPAHPGTGILNSADLEALGTARYYVQAWLNHAVSETRVVTVALPATCGTGTGGLAIRDEMLMLDAPVELAYFYASINGGAYRRYPAAEGAFFPPNDGKLNLNEILIPTLLASEPPYHLRLEVWGWQGGRLVPLGNLTDTLGATILQIARNYNGDLEQEVLSEEVAPGLNGSTNVETWFRWQSTIRNIDGVLAQVALSPFPADPTAEPAGGILLAKFFPASTADETVTVGSFPLHFLDMALDAQGGSVSADDPTAPQGGSAQTLLSGLMMQVDPSGVGGNAENPNALPVFYIRVIPVAGAKTLGSPSNSVSVKQTEAVVPTGLITPIPKPEIPFDVEFVRDSYTDPVAPWADWGCVYIRDLDPDLADNPATAPWYLIWKQFSDTQAPYCPSDYSEPGFGILDVFTSLWDWISSAWGWLSDLYNSIKAGVVGFVADALAGIGIPGTEGLLNLALNTGLTALGIPPEMPDFSRLTDEGLSYLVEEAVAQIGPECGDLCKQAVQAGFSELKEQMTTQTVSSFEDEAIAKEHGKNPLYLPPAGTATIVPVNGDHWTYGTIQIRVTRKPDSGGLTPEQFDATTFFFKMKLFARNASTAGRSFGLASGTWQHQQCDDYNCTYWYDNDYTYAANGGLEGNLYGAALNIPYLAPGDTKIVTVTLIPNQYLPDDLPNREQFLRVKYANGIPYNNLWDHLYEGGPDVKFSLNLAAQFHQSGQIMQSWSWEDLDPYEFVLRDIGEMWMMISPVKDK